MLPNTTLLNISGHFKRAILANQCGQHFEIKSQPPPRIFFIYGPVIIGLFRISNLAELFLNINAISDQTYGKL